MKNTTQVKMLLCGDFRAADPSRIILSENLKELVRTSDVKVCNFEAPIKVPNAKPIIKSGPALSQSTEAPRFLMNFGFNVILLANNHIMDYGKEGCEATLKAFSNVTTIGAGSAGDAFAIKFIEIKGKKIGFCSLVQNEFGTVENKDEDRCGAAWINSPDVPEIVIKAKKECDFLLIFPHAGAEHTVAPLPEWRRLYKRFIDWGADAVVASHPHSPQGWEDYKDKRIYYSLGNFYFDELTYDDWWFKSIAVELSIDENNAITYKEHFLKFDANGLISIDDSFEIKERVNYANLMLENENQYYGYINRMCEGRYRGMRYGILRGVCGISFKMKLKYIIRLLGCMLLGNTDEPYLLNAIRCESHRWVMQRALENRNRNNKTIVS